MLSKRLRSTQLWFYTILVIIAIIFLWYRNKRKTLKLKEILIDKEEKSQKIKQAHLKTREELLEKQEALSQKEREAIETQKKLLQLEERISVIKHDRIKNSAIRVKNLINGFLTVKISKEVSLDQLIKAKHTANRIIYIAQAPINRVEELYNYDNPKKLHHFVKEMHQVAEEQSNILNISAPSFEDYEEVADFMIKPRVQSIIIDRIIGNAFDNIGCHSECKNASLSVQANSRRLIIQIEDDGKGFAMDRIRNGAKGINNIIKGAESLGGSATINSKEGKGTKIRIVIPRPFIK